ncbi:hypothetical protein ACFL2L_00560 [Patescibacteria group bacterium]
MFYQDFKQSLIKSIKTFKVAMPIMIGILMLISLITVNFQKYYTVIFTGNKILDPLIGAIAGSISFGIPITSYIVGGELLKQGVSLLAVSAFIMTWTTVGLAMIPLEASFLGKKFAISRNIVNFIFAILIALLTIYTIKIF